MAIMFVEIKYRLMTTYCIIHADLLFIKWIAFITDKAEIVTEKCIHHLSLLE